MDGKKRVLWVTYLHKEGLHDSSCLRDTKLYKKLQEMKYSLYGLDYFILGDSAYLFVSFLLVSFDSPGSKTAEVDFNFYHSSARITAECASERFD